MNCCRIFFCFLSFTLITFSAAAEIVAANPTLVAKDYFSDLDESEKIQLSIKQFEVSVTLHAGYAETVSTVEFYNPTESQLEGDFILKLPTGSIITGYGLDVNGQMIDGVIVEKQKAKKTFEDRIREGIDPGLAELTRDHHFKSRVFPINANESRIISIRFVSPVSKTQPYQLPLKTLGEVDSFSIDVTDRDNGTKPTVELQSGFELTWSEEAVPVGHGAVTNSVIDGLLSIQPQTISNFSVERHPNGQSFLSITLPEPIADQNAKRPSSISIYWDTSLSHQESAPYVHEFISRFTDVFGEIPIELIPFSSTALRDRIVKNEHNGDIIAAILDTAYHGATNFQAVFNSEKYRQKSEVCLLITDGHITLGNFPTDRLSCRLHTVTAASDANRGALDAIAKVHRGRFIDLTRINIESAVATIEYPASAFLKLEVNGRLQSTGIEWSYDGDSFRLVTPVNATPRRVKVFFDNTEYESRLTRDDFSNGTVFGSVWASKQLASLRSQGGKRKDLIRLSKSYSVVGEETSLLVLEEIEDYVENRIALPNKGFDDEAKETYLELLKVAEAERIAEKSNRLNSVIEMWEDQLSWYEKKYDPTPKTASESEDTTAVTGSRLNDADPESDDTIVVTGSRLNEADLDSSSEVFQVDSEEISTRGLTRVDDLINVLPQAYASQDNATLDGLEGSQTLVNKWSPERPYLKAVEGLCHDLFMAEYFTQRTKYGGLASYYFEMADALAECGNVNEAISIVLSALELRNANIDTTTIVANKLIKYGSYDLAIDLLKNVTEVMPDRPQPFRNLALAQDAVARSANLNRREKRKLYRSAIFNLNHIVTNVWDEDYDGIEIISIMETNRIVERLKSLGGRERIFDDRLQTLLDVDIRVVTSWNADIVDIDLWLTEPSGEVAKYSNPLTAIGGRLSNDMTRGYGPEEYLLKNAVDGEYEVQLDYYSSDIVNPNGPVVAQVQIFRNWGRPNESVDVVDLEFTDDEQSEYLVGSITIE